MKKVLFIAGICFTTLSALAQTNNIYDITVFRNSGYNSVSVGKVNEVTKTAQLNFPGWAVEVDRLSGKFKNLFGPAITLQGTDITEKVHNCMTEKLNKLGVEENEWKKLSTNVVSNATLVYYQQQFDGHSVAFSRLSFRLTTDGRLVMVQMKNYGTPDKTITATLTAEQAKDAAIQDLSALTIKTNTVDANWEWFPIPSDNGYDLHPAWHFDIIAQTQSGTPVLLKGYVDAVNGKVLYRSNSVKDAADLIVNGSVNKDGATSPATVQPLPDLLVKIGSTSYYTDTAGYFSVGTVTLPATANVRLEGRWSKVVDNPTGNTPNFNFSITSTGLAYTFSTAAPSSLRHINAYYHVNRVHNFMKLCYPSFTGMDFTLPTNVDLTSGTCNAFYNGSSINFYAAGGGCESFAPIGTVVYHEYGHGISDKYYSMIKGGGSITNGSLNEGNSDVWAMCVSHSPIVGEGASSGGTGYIRRYDVGPKVYPNDLTGEVHANGAIIAGAWWDVAVNLGSVDSMAKLFTLTYNDVPDGPDGTEGDVYHQVLISALLNDDIDTNITNGTPHFSAIVKAFAKHGIYLLSNSTFSHNEIANQPSGVTIPVSDTFTASYPFFFKDVNLFYKIRSTVKWDTVAMTTTGGGIYTANIPAQSKGAIVDYFFSITDTMNESEAYYPENYNPSNSLLYNTLPYQFGVGISARYTNDFETTTAGWTIGRVTGDDATAGIWIWALPVRTGPATSPCQTGNDHTTGKGKCLVTGNTTVAMTSVNNADVDNGKTTVLTPAFDLTGFTNPVIEYYRWFGNDWSNNPKEDLWQVQVRDSTSTIWYYADRTFQSDYHWRRRIFALKEVTPSKKNVQFRFVAQDPIEPSLPFNGQSTVEAAVDDFMIYDLDDVSGVRGIAKERMQVYPNPANDKLRIVIPNVSGNGTIMLYDMSGRLASGMSLQANIIDYEMNIAAVSPGQYFLVINTGNFIQSQKVVINH